VYEVDFLPVGDGGRSGDAIALRYSTTGSWSDQVVVVIDGGFGDDGPELADHIQRWYGTSAVDLVVSTHPDGDHVGGLSHVLEHLTVRELLVHDPRAHLSSTDGLALDAVLGLIELADELGVPRTEPYTGLTRFGGSFTVCGPTQAYYDELTRWYPG
jgi:beta-lactamase superfamily II metal-dependent hydrolase